MSFSAALEAATTLATTYTKLRETQSGMACASDHDRNWGPDDDKALDQVEAQVAELTEQLATALAGITRDYRTDWQNYLTESIARLDVVTRNVKKSYVVAEYERDQWTRWSRGQLPPADHAEIFARGIKELAENRELIDRAIPKA